jgi:hypothetical protein
MFLRSAVQPEDTFILFDRPIKPFSVQLDPAIEVVVLFDLSWRREFGDWSSDRYADVLATVQERYGVPG